MCFKLEADYIADANATQDNANSFQYKQRFYYASMVWNPRICLLNCLFVPSCIVFY